MTTEKNNDNRLFKAIENGDLEEVKRLVENDGVKVETVNEYNVTPLHIAVKLNKLEVVQFLVTKGANVNAIDGCNRTPLHIAAEQNNTEVAKFLVTNGANINALDQWQRAPLHNAAISGNLEVVKFLVANGAGVNNRMPLNDSLQFTPLNGALSNNHINGALSNNHLKVAEFLIENHADVDAIDQSKGTLLHKAVGASKLDVAQFLVKNGAKIDKKDNEGQTVLDIAKQSIKTTRLIQPEKIKKVNGTIETNLFCLFPSEIFCIFVKMLSKNQADLINFSTSSKEIRKVIVEASPKLQWCNFIESHTQKNPIMNLADGLTEVRNDLRERADSFRDAIKKFTERLNKNNSTSKDHSK